MNPFVFFITADHIGIAVSAIPFHGESVFIAIHLCTVEQESLACFVVQAEQLTVFSGSIMTGRIVPQRDGKGILIAAKDGIGNIQPVLFIRTLGG